MCRTSRRSRAGSPPLYSLLSTLHSFLLPAKLICLAVRFGDVDACREMCHADSVSRGRPYDRMVFSACIMLIISRVGSRLAATYRAMVSSPCHPGRTKARPYYVDIQVNIWEASSGYLTNLYVFPADLAM